jgi:hypothetical protein
MSKSWSKKENTTGIYARHTFRKVSDTATATQVGQTAIAIKTLSLLLLRQEKRESWNSQ